MDLPVAPSASAPAPRHVLDSTGQVLLTLSLEPAALLRLIWSGTTDAAGVRRGAESILQAVRDWQPRVILNGGGHSVGDWHDLVPWIAFELAPQVAAMRVQAVAFLPPASPAGRLAMFALLDSIPTGGLPMRYFEDETSARAWLAEVTERLSA